eukprot:15460814-Alexandrium_andersonii.AAC.1
MYTSLASSPGQCGLRGHDSAFWVSGLAQAAWTTRAKRMPAEEARPRPCWSLAARKATCFWTSSVPKAK